MGSRVLFFIGACAGIFYILMTVLLGGGNVIGEAASFVAIASGLLGMLRPKQAMFYLVILAAYSDLLKRLMILDGRFGMMDVMWVRALCPMTLAGIFLGVMASSLHSGRIFERRNLGTLLLCSAGFLAAGVSALRSAGGFGALTQLADGASYIFLLVIVPLVFPKPGEIIRFLKYTLIVFVPVSLYGIKQQLLGLSEFEIEYLKSGFTVLSKHLEDVRPRPFSTLVDSSPFGTSMAVCACLALMIRSHYRSNQRRDWNLQGVVLAVIFIAGCLASMTRFANINWFLPILLLPFLSHPRTTALLYGGMAASFVAICVWAKPIKGVITDATYWAMNAFGHTALGEQWARFWTLGARLDGMYELAHNPRMWTPFGYGPQLANEMKESGEISSHDVISNMLLEFGWVPLIAILVIAALCLRSLHGSVLAMRGTPVFPMCLWLLSTEFGLIVHNVFAGNVTTTFPVNFFFWFIAGALNACVGWHEARVRETEPEAPAGAPSWTPPAAYPPRAAHPGS